MIPENMIEKAKRIQCLICDIDGVLTDGYLYIAADTSESRAFHVHDGMGLKLLMLSGIQVAVITTSRVPVIDHRMKQLGIKHYYRGQVSKMAAFEDLKTKLQLPDEAFAYIGDDVPDLDVMEKIGLSIAVSNAVPDVIARVNWVTQKAGGHGAVREVADALLTLNNTASFALQEYLKQTLGVTEKVLQ